MKANKLLDLVSEEIEIKDSGENSGVRISIWIPEGVLDAYKTVANKLGVGYQTIINQVLKEFGKGKEK